MIEIIHSKYYLSAAYYSVPWSTEWALNCTRVEGEKGRKKKKKGKKEFEFTNCSRIHLKYTLAGAHATHVALVFLHLYYVHTSWLARPNINSQLYQPRRTVEPAHPSLSITRQTIVLAWPG